MTASLTVAPVGDVYTLTSLYTLRCADEILEFVNVHAYLYPLLMEAPEHIGRIFGAETEMILEMFHDDEDHSPAELFLLIRTTNDPESAMQQQEDLRRKWWQSAARRAQNQMNISLEFA